jgi:hypothetical protein
MFRETVEDRRARRWAAVAERRGEGLLVGARPIGLAEMVCRRIVGRVRVVDDTLLLAADPAWAGAINTVLVKKGVRVSELRRAEDRWAL